jgi:hypothetical protein
VESRRQYQLALYGPRPRATARLADWSDGLRMRLTEADRAYRAWSLTKIRFFAVVRRSIARDLHDFDEESIQLGAWDAWL